MFACIGIRDDLTDSAGGYRRVYRVYGHLTGSGDYVHPETFTNKKKCLAFATKIGENLDRVNLDVWTKIVN